MNNFEQVFNQVTSDNALGKRRFYKNLLDDLAAVPESKWGEKYSFTHDDIKHIAIVGDFGSWVVDETGAITMQTIFHNSLWNDVEFAKLMRRAMLVGLALISFQEAADQSVNDNPTAETFRRWMDVTILPVIETLEKM